MRSPFHPFRQLPLLAPILAVFLLARTPSAQAAPIAHPNILLILSDDQSARHMHCAGDPNVKTPRLDQLAAESIRFTRAYSTASQCAPARKSLLTGRSPAGLQQTLFTLPLQREATIFPEILRSDLGFRTGLVGRTPHLDGNSDPWINEVANRYHMRNTRQRVDVFQIATAANGNTQALNTVDQFRAFLDNTPADQPFFAQVCFSDPHREWDEAFHPVKHDPEKLKLPGHYPDTIQLRKDLAAYYDEVARVDFYVGKVLGELQTRGLASNTIVIYMSDNGSSTLRGKGTLYESGVRVPLLVRWPGVAAPKVSNALISGEDLAPTMLEAMGLPVPEDMTGISFLPILKGQPFTPRNHVFAERSAHTGLPVDSAAYDEIRTVIGDRFKLIYNAIPSLPYVPIDFKKSPAWRSIAEAQSKGKLSETFRRMYLSKSKPIFELYDLKNDPSELVNLAEKPAFLSIRKTMQKHMVEWLILERDHVPLPLEAKENGGD